MKLHSIAAVGALALSALAPTRSRGQVPTQGQIQLPGGLPAGMTPDQLAQLLQQNPQLAGVIRQRLQQSGLTPDQIRGQLAAGGYPSNLLDSYLGAAAPGGTPALGSQELAALQALGLLTPGPGTESIPVDTGFMRARAHPLDAESLATGNYVFGLDVFRRATTQFLPVLSGPVPPDYKLGTGDQLVLILTGGIQRAATLSVTREGFILIPEVGQVFVANLTLEQLRNVLFDRLRQVYSRLGRGPNAGIQFDIAVASVRVNQVSVVGEVQQPGAYNLSALGTVLTALYAAGGVTHRANMRHVEVRRLGRPLATLDLYDYLLRGDTHRDIRLESGDVVFVPLHGRRVQVSGAVLRPAIYELADGETLPDLLWAAGGFRPNALLERLAVYRILPAPARKPGPLPRAAVSVPLAVASDPPPASSAGSAHSAEDPRPVAAGDFGGVTVPSLPLETGDSVVVDSIGPLDTGLYVGIGGMVQKPGHYPWQDGMTLRDLVRLAGGPAIGAYLKEAEVARLPAERAQGQLAQTVRVPIDSTYLFERDRAGRYIGAAGLPFPAPGALELLLEPYDNVLILKQPDFELQRTVFVGGEVRFPGTYSLRSKDERLMDLLDRVGGLTPQAYPNGIRFYRKEADAGRVGIDLPRVLKDRRGKDNMLLAAGDSIVIPAYVSTVRVQGEVNSPGSVTYVQGQGLDYYLNAAGGVSFRGDKARVYVQQPNGNVRAVHKRPLFLGTIKPTPEPGALVVVPVRDTTSHSNVAAVLSAVGTIVAALTTIVVVVVNHR
jgi:protein involved in polysaccharide export with SLBB domain